jgi:hypothetical protein
MSNAAWRFGVLFGVLFFFLSSPNFFSVTPQSHYQSASMLPKSLYAPSSS